MLLLTAVAALAAPPDLSRWERPPGLALPAWVVEASTVWVKDGETCRAGDIEDAAKAKLAVPLCTLPHGVTWEAVVSLADGWNVRGLYARSVAGEHFGTQRTHLWPIVAADETRVAFREPIALNPVVAARRFEERACTEASWKAIGKQWKPELGNDPTVDALGRWLEAHELTIEGARRCLVSAELSVVESGPTSASDTTVRGEPVDCREPCPEDVTAELEAARAAVAGTWVRREAPEIGLYRTKAACEAAPPAAPIWPPCDELTQPNF